MDIHPETASNIWSPSVTQPINLTADHGPHRVRHDDLHRSETDPRPHVTSWPGSTGSLVRSRRPDRQSTQTAPYLGDRGQPPGDQRNRASVTSVAVAPTASTVARWRPGRCRADSHPRAQDEDRPAQRQSLPGRAGQSAPQPIHRHPPKTNTPVKASAPQTTSSPTPRAGTRSRPVPLLRPQLYVPQQPRDGPSFSGLGLGGLPREDSHRRGRPRPIHDWPGW